MEFLNGKIVATANAALERLKDVNQDMIFAFSVGVLIACFIIVVRRYYYSFQYPYSQIPLQVSPGTRRLITLSHHLAQSAPVLPVFNALLEDYVAPRKGMSGAKTRFSKARIKGVRVPLLLIHAQSLIPLLVMFDLPSERSSFLKRSKAKLVAKATVATGIRVYSLQRNGKQKPITDELKYIASLLTSDFPVSGENARVEPVLRETNTDSKKAGSVENRSGRAIFNGQKARVPEFTAEDPEPLIDEDAGSIFDPVDHEKERAYIAAEIPQRRAGGQSASPRSSEFKAPAEDPIENSSANKTQKEALFGLKDVVDRVGASAKDAFHKAADSVDKVSRRMDNSIGNSSRARSLMETSDYDCASDEDLIDDPLAAEYRAAKTGVIAVKRKREFIQDEDEQREDVSLFGRVDSSPANRVGEM